MTPICKKYRKHCCELQKWHANWRSKPEPDWLFGKLKALLLSKSSVLPNSFMPYEEDYGHLLDCIATRLFATKAQAYPLQAYQPVITLFDSLPPQESVTTP